MINNKLGVWLGVVSHGRPEAVPKVHELLGSNATWYVGIGEGDSYRSKGAYHVVESGKLLASRNRILDDAFEANIPAVQFSDDPVSLKQAILYRRKITSQILSFQTAVEYLLDGLQQTRMKLAGCAPTANEFFFDPRRVISFNRFIVGDFTVTMPTELRYDENLTLKEDYDYTLQHIQKYGGVARRNDILAEFKHYTNEGGVVDYRSVAEEQKNIAYLKKKWGASIKDNKKRPNEILLAVK